LEDLSGSGGKGMIQEYFRPQDLASALELLKRQQPKTIPLGGGTAISHMGDTELAVVDLQSLPLNHIEVTGNSCAVGATVTLEQLYQCNEVSPALKEAIHLEEQANIRNMATIAGSIVSGSGESSLLTCLLALDARLTWQPADEKMAIGDFLPLRKTGSSGKLITQIEWPLQVELRFASVGRTPLDKPLVCLALARWASGRMRLTLGGLTPAPILALDGTDSGGAEEALNNACSHLSNRWASKAYLSQTSKTLLHRLLGEQLA
jgi:CO/xanthine dehydrogenase FAD-binding subunit